MTSHWPGVTPDRLQAVYAVGVVVGFALIIAFGREPPKVPKDPKLAEQEAKEAAEIAEKEAELAKKETEEQIKAREEAQQKQLEKMYEDARKRKEAFLSKFDPETRKTVEDYFTTKAREALDRAKKGELPPERPWWQSEKFFFFCFFLLVMVGLGTFHERDPLAVFKQFYGIYMNFKTRGGASAGVPPSIPQPPPLHGGEL